jgi:hypothetical protein
MSHQSFIRPQVLELLQAVFRSLTEEPMSEDSQTQETASVNRLARESASAGFRVPSRELALEMLEVPGGGEAVGLPAESLEEVTKDLQEDVLGTLADFAFTAIERGDKRVELGALGRFSSGFAGELMRTLPIEPYAAPTVLHRLYEELLDAARSGAIQASWGHLVEGEKGLEILLPQRSSLNYRQSLTTTAK